MNWHATEFAARMDHSAHVHTYRAWGRFGDPFSVEYGHDHPGGGDAHNHPVAEILDKLLGEYGVAP